MRKDEHPKILFEQLMGVQLKYAGNVQVQVLEGNLVTQSNSSLTCYVQQHGSQLSWNGATSGKSGYVVGVTESCECRIN
jgi:hypothetical protein